MEKSVEDVPGKQRKNMKKHLETSHGFPEKKLQIMMSKVIHGKLCFWCHQPWLDNSPLYKCFNYKVSTSRMSQWHHWPGPGRNSANDPPATLAMPEGCLKSYWGKVLGKKKQARTIPKFKMCVLFSFPRAITKNSLSRTKLYASHCGDSSFLWPTNPLVEAPRLIPRIHVLSF